MPDNELHHSPPADHRDRLQEGAYCHDNHPTGPCPETQRIYTLTKSGVSKYVFYRERPRVPGDKSQHVNGFAPTNTHLNGFTKTMRLNGFASTINGNVKTLKKQKRSEPPRTSKDLRAPPSTSEGTPEDRRGPPRTSKHTARNDQNAQNSNCPYTNELDSPQSVNPLKSFTQHMKSHKSY